MHVSARSTLVDMAVDECVLRTQPDNCEHARSLGCSRAAAPDLIATPRRSAMTAAVRKSRGSKLCFRLSLYVFFLAWEMSKIQCLDFLLASYRRPNPERSRLLPSHERDRRALLIRDASRRGHVIRGSSRPGCESSRHTLKPNLGFR